MGRSGRSRWWWVVVIGVAAAVVAASATAQADSTAQPLRADGITVGPDGELTNVPVASGATYLPETSVLATDDPPTTEQEARIASDRVWLRSGERPGRGTPYADMADRVLLDLHLLLQPDGALLAANRYHWRYVWPRDASFAIVALSATGRHTDAETILRFLSRVAPERGIWHARYRPDGTGEPPDDRRRQLDGSGWVPWALWFWLKTHPDRGFAEMVVRDVAPTVVTSANAIVRSFGDDDLPRATPDYWEQGGHRLTLGIAAPARLGLRAAVDLAPLLGADPAPWRDAAIEIDTGIRREFGARGYPRTIADTNRDKFADHGYPLPFEDAGHDASLTFLSPPFAAAEDRIHGAFRRTDQALRVPNGGLKPGEDWETDQDVAWTPTTALFALAAAGYGDIPLAEQHLGWLDAHRTALGALPEKVNEVGQPASVAPLGWTGSLVLLALVALERDLPIPPAP
jgi:GH15 family glucan-1,4-alpha-glucosidase